VTAALALLLAILIWASNSIMVKIALREITPLTLTWLRYLLAALFYVPFAVATWRRAPGYTSREWVLLVGAGVALVPVFSLTLYWALTYTSVANTALVRMTEPACWERCCSASARRAGSWRAWGWRSPAPLPSCSSGGSHP
jgi:drug/metabolite transporter (DMT)-like permease